MKSEIDEQFSHTLEIINSLVAVFIFTEIFRYNHHNNNIHHDSKKSRFYHCFKLILPWVIINICLHYISFLKYGVSSFASLIYLLFSPFVAIGEMIGSSLIVFSLILIIYVLYRAFNHSNGFNTNYSIILTEWNNYSIEGYQQIYQDLFIILSISIFVLIIRLLGFDHVMSHTESMKIVLLIFLFLLLLYLDISRIHEIPLSLSIYITCILQAIGYSLLAIPIVAIGISFICLILLSILDKVGIDSEHSEVVNQVVFYCTIYGPFYLIYWNAKTRLLTYPVLPLH